MLKCEVIFERALSLGFFAQTFENFKGDKTPIESGSDSTDLGGAARIAPLVYFYREDAARLIDSARAQTAMTHNTDHVIASAEFFARVAARVLHGTAPVSALNRVMKEAFNKEPFLGWIKDGLSSRSSDTREATLDFGQMCETNAAFPSVIHLIAKYEDDLKEALVQNVMAGGDSASRGMMVGMILGAHHGMDAIENDWLNELKDYQDIIHLLETVDTYM